MKKQTQNLAEKSVKSRKGLIFKIAVFFGVIFCVLGVVFIAHLIYRDKKIETCPYDVGIDVFYDCSDSDNVIKCEQEIADYIKSETQKAKREMIHCKFLFNCEC